MVGKSGVPTIGSSGFLNVRDEEATMPPTDTHVLTRDELEEAITRYTQDAKAAFDAGNLLRWSRRHEQINDLFDEWRWVTFVG